MTLQPIDRALTAFDEVNARDPNLEVVDGREQPRELVQARRFSRWVERLAPEASPALRLAARCQHIERWKIPRHEYPQGRVGYLKWRKDLAKHHARVAGEILEAYGVDPETIAAVRRINLKQNLKRDAEAQTMEDALCLSFLEHELGAFAKKHEESKLCEIIKKTWEKMSPRARELALELDFAPELLALIKKAVSLAEADLS